MKVYLMLLLCVVAVYSGPTLYRLNQDEAEEVKIPVSSTVIPLDDLPEFEVGFGFGLVDRDQVKKPAFLKGIKLITSKNKHRFIASAGVEKLTKAEFESFASSAA